MLSWTAYVKGVGPRGVHAAVTVGHKVYAFGEYCDGGRTNNYNNQIDVHVFNTVSQRWMKLPLVTNGRGGERVPEAPSVRDGHTAVLIDTTVYIWGGNTYTDEKCNVLYGFTVDTHRWSRPKVSGTLPEETSGHSACVLGKVMYIYSGYNRLTKHHTKDVYKLDTVAMGWSLITPRGSLAPASTYHSATMIGKKMFVFGGLGKNQIHYNIISVFDTETGCWLRTPSTQLLPERRTFHSAFAYNGELYVFGGDNYQLVRIFNDLWKYNPQTFSWKKVEPKGQGPCWVTKMCCCLAGDHVVLLGGHRSLDKGCNRYMPANDVYILELSPSLEGLCERAVIRYRLKQVGLPHDWTVSLQGGPKGVHAAVAVGHKVYSFGEHCDGEDYNYGQIRIHVFNTVSLRWTKLPPVMARSGDGSIDTALEVPSMRDGHTAVLIDNSIYIWGGCAYAGEMNCDVLYTFSVNTHTWSKPEVSGPVPEATGGHSASALGRVMYIYGGYNRRSKCYTNDLYKLDTAAMAWSLIKPRGTPAAPASIYHSSTVIGTKLFVFGGRGDHQVDYNSISVFDTETNRWLKTPTAQLLPERRTCHSAFAYDGEFYVFGGHNYQLVRTFNDLWKFNPETFTWKKVEPKGQGPCWITKMCCCAVGDRVVLFGGYRYRSATVNGGYNRNKPADNLYILDLSPSLKTLCKIAVTQHVLEHSGLPHDIRWELDAMTATTGHNSRHTR